jgi:hypothetical protein
LPWPADAGYSGHLCKNLMNGHWITSVFRQDGYSLPELSEYIPDLSRFNDKRTKLPEYGLGRNVSHSNQLRLWAYKAVNATETGILRLGTGALRRRRRNTTISPRQWTETRSSIPPRAWPPGYGGMPRLAPYGFPVFRLPAAPPGTIGSKKSTAS